MTLVDYEDSESSEDEQTDALAKEEPVKLFSQSQDNAKKFKPISNITGKLTKSLPPPDFDKSERTSFPSTANVSFQGERKRSPEESLKNRLEPYKKIGKCDLPASKVPPDTNRGQLLPPQLRGRSNVVTEDLEKMFSKRPKT